MATAPEEADEDEGPTVRFGVRLSVQTMDYLKAIKKKGVYGKTATAVVRSFIDAGVREAIDKKYIQVTDD